MTPGTNWQPEDVFLARVKRAYRHALLRDGPPPRRSIWGAIGTRQADVHAALMAEDHTRLRAIFSDPGSTDLFYGVDNLCRSVPVDENAAAGLASQAEHLFTAADLHTKRFAFPNPFKGECGFDTGHGVASYRAILSAAQAMRVRALATGPVIEIGPGLGRVALHARQLGIRDYTTVDLPMGIVAQACFLGASAGPDAIWFQTDEFPPGDRIRLMTFGDVKRSPRQYSLALNADSIVEMDFSSAARYAIWVRRNADAFLSINTKRRRVVSFNMLALLFFSLTQRERLPWPLREGYFEDRFSFT